jgi:hypothetical protein
MYFLFLWFPILWIKEAHSVSVYVLWINSIIATKCVAPCHRHRRSYSQPHAHTWAYICPRLNAAPIHHQRRWPHQRASPAPHRHPPECFRPQSPWSRRPMSSASSPPPPVMQCRGALSSPSSFDKKGGSRGSLRGGGWGGTSRVWEYGGLHRRSGRVIYLLLCYCTTTVSKRAPFRSFFRQTHRTVAEVLQAWRRWARN